MASFLLGKYLGREWWVHVVGVWLILKTLPNIFCGWTIWHPTNLIREFWVMLNLECYCCFNGHLHKVHFAIHRPKSPCIFFTDMSLQINCSLFFLNGLLAFIWLSHENSGHILTVIPLWNISTKNHFSLCALLFIALTRSLKGIFNFNKV